MKDSDIIGPVVEYYEQKLASFGATARGVDWKDEQSQRKRFEEIVRALRLDEQSGRFTIVDVGCGYGALLPFLRGLGTSFHYTGFDRSAAMIAQARRDHESAEATFTSDWDAVPDVDFVVASGVFNVRVSVPDDAWWSYILRTLTAMHVKSRVGWAANFLTSHSDAERKRPDLYYADPSAVLAWCQQSKSRWVSLLHDYELYEFTIGVRRRPGS